MAQNHDTPGAVDAQTLAGLEAHLSGVAAAQRQLNVELELSDKLGQQFGKALSTAFVGVAAQGKSLGDVVQSLGQSLSRLALNAAFKPLETAVGDMLNSALQSTASLPVPFTSGGTIAATPGLSLADPSVMAASGQALGSASAASGIGGSGSTAPSVILNVTTPDAESFRRSETQLAAVLARAVGHGHRNL